MYLKVLMEDVYILRIVLIACLNHIYISLYVVSSKTTSVLFSCISHTQDCDIHVSQFGTRGWAAARRQLQLSYLPPPNQSRM